MDIEKMMAFLEARYYEIIRCSNALNEQNYIVCAYNLGYLTRSLELKLHDLRRELEDGQADNEN